MSQITQTQLSPEQNQAQEPVTQQPDRNVEMADINVELQRIGEAAHAAGAVATRTEVDADGRQWVVHRLPDSHVGPQTRPFEGLRTRPSQQVRGGDQLSLAPANSRSRRK